MVRQLADEPHGIGDQRGVSVAQIDTARGRVQRREQAILDEHVGSGKGLQQRRLAGVGVPHQRGTKLPLAGLSLNLPGPRHLTELVLQIGDPGADQSTVGLELGLARTPQPDAPPDPGQVTPHTLEARKQVFELGELDLHARLLRPGAGGEDVQDQLGSIHDPHPRVLLEVLALSRGELFVEDHEVGLRRRHQLPQFVGLALADVHLGRRRIDALADHADHLTSGGIGQAREFREVFLGDAGIEPPRRSRHE